jgi:AcrR family transcriptional regulator
MAQGGKVDRLVEAAQALFAEVGFDKTGVREIAGRAHVAVGTLYAHFPGGKAQVLKAAIDHRVSLLLDEVQGVTDGDRLEQFIARAHALNRGLVDDPFLRRLLRDQDRLAEPDLREQGRRIVRSFEKLAITELHELERHHAVGSVDVEALAALLRVTTLGWIVADSAGQEQVDYGRVESALLGALRLALLPGAR